MSEPETTPPNDAPETSPAPPAEGSAPDEAFDARRPLIVVMAIALVINTLAALFDDEIYADAIYWYYPMARALVAGDLVAGFDIAVPPGHPILIAIVHLLGVPVGAAGEVVSVVCGALLAVPLYLIGRRIGGPRLGIALAVIGTLHPSIVRYACQTKSEIPLALFVLFAVERGLALVERPGIGRSIAFGAAVGWAYLMKPEGYALLPVIGLWLVAWEALQAEQRLKAVGRSIGLLALAGVVFYAIALVNIANVYSHTGQWMLTNKTGITITNRVLLDSPMPQRLNPEHTDIRMHAQIYRNECIRETSLLRVFRADPGGQARRVAGNLGEAFGKMPDVMMFWPLAFLVLGVATGKKRGAVWRLEGLTFFVMCAYLCAFSLLWVARRMLIPVMPLGLVWAAIGLVWAVDLAAEKKPALGWLRAPWWLIAVCALTALLGAVRVAKKNDFRFLDSPQRTVAAWMKERIPELGPEVAVMADPAEIAHFVGARYVYFPTDATDATLEYARHKKVRYIAVDELDLQVRAAFIADLQDAPRPGVVPLGVVEDGDRRVRIYRLDP